jgi:glycosyltransferase involved in cell wall biosynthesis
MTKPTLSVVMGNYNHAHYLRESLPAILNQSYRPAEVIVIDDGSTDNSVEVIEQLARNDPVFRLVRHEKNRGILVTANRLLEFASGDYIYAAAADDKVLPEFFEKSMALLAEHPQAGLCCSDPVFFDGETGDVTVNRLYISRAPIFLSPGELVKILRRRLVHIAGHTSIVSRKALMEAGGWIPALRWHCDWFGLLVIAFRHGICYVPEALASMRGHNHSYSAQAASQADAQREVLSTMLTLLHSPEFQDVLPAFRDSAALSIFGGRLLGIILRKPEYHCLLSFRLVQRVFSLETRKALSPYIPSTIELTYRRRRERLLSRGSATRTVPIN